MSNYALFSCVHSRDEMDLEGSIWDIAKTTFADESYTCAHQEVA